MRTILLFLCAGYGIALFQYLPIKFEPLEIFSRVRHPAEYGYLRLRNRFSSITEDSVTADTGL